MTRKHATHLHLTREPGLCIAGRDEHGVGWTGIDATRTETSCARCGERMQYGYQPWKASAALIAYCVSCVVFNEEA